MARQSPFQTGNKPKRDLDLVYYYYLIEVEMDFYPVAAVLQ
jgi:hypothetical protein